MTVPQFILEEKINEGATTTVYKAHQSVLGRTVLLKILHKHLIDDRELTERFAREARACALIRSEFIVQVYDLTEIDGAPAIVMEYVEGTSLKDVLAAEGPMTAPRARLLVIEILNALRAAHACGVIHRDIKPGNILVTEAGHIKVTDFGLAAIAASPTVTLDGAVLGTPAYLPPEHIRGEPADERSDLFSLGTTYVELLTGRRIFEGASYSACINTILRFDPLSLDALITDPASAEVIKKLMHPDRERRYPSADAALAALHGEPEKILPPPAPPPLTPSRLRLAALGLVVVLVGMTWMYLRAPNEPSSSTSIPSLRPSADTAGGLSRETLTAASSPSRPGKTSIAEPAIRGTQEPASDPAVKTVVTPAGKDSSGLLITCTPWGKVFLDNQYLGETPLGGVVTIRAGTHTINFTNPQFLPIVKTFTAVAGAQLTIGANFFETAGYLVITVIPWAEVYIDDQYRDTTPMEKPIMVTAGKRKIRLHNPGFADSVIDVTVAVKDTLRLSYSLTGAR